MDGDWRGLIPLGCFGFAAAFAPVGGDQKWHLGMEIEPAWLFVAAVCFPVVGSCVAIANAVSRARRRQMPPARGWSTTLPLRPFASQSPWSRNRTSSRLLCIQSFAMVVSREQPFVVIMLAAKTYLALLRLGAVQRRFAAAFRAAICGVNAAAEFRIRGCWIAQAMPAA